MRQREADIARMGTEGGMAFQSYNLFPHVNVIENLTMAPIHRNYTYRPVSHAAITSNTKER